MFHLCLVRNIKIAKLEKVRLYSQILTNPIILNKKIAHNEQKRTFSLQSTIESIIKTQSGIFKTLSESVPVSYAQDFVLYVHSSTGLPWWASIILTTVFLRSCLTVPLAIYQNYILAKVENLHAEMPAIVEELKRETAVAIKRFKWDERTAKLMFKRSVCINKILKKKI